MMFKCKGKALCQVELQLMHEINWGDNSDEWLDRVGETLGEMSYWFRLQGGVEPSMSDEGEHYVYVVTDDSNDFDDIVYIGSGKGPRYKHVKSGASSNRILNQMCFENTNLHQMMYSEHLSQEDSLQLEGDLIAYFNPRANVKGITDMGDFSKRSPFMKTLDLFVDRDNK